ncbi:hypothetical protein J8273_5044 [Carpediemonas membranifera]|uniref:Uncharacterized protein n=1 Tax=Carpediemonas membranifera TaxID=201153 RepID=A0A8J6B5Z6_9EUKA|nr:hypothetical protein J8273_5044 [Carpediemonas membranifera]|eukprot:KAG9393557.1 hypothetical protein J8273_5044 [Carpediemonas membranifera]
MDQGVGQEYRALRAFELERMAHSVPDQQYMMWNESLIFYELNDPLSFSMRTSNDDDSDGSDDSCVPSTPTSIQFTSFEDLRGIYTDALRSVEQMRFMPPAPHRPASPSNGADSGSTEVSAPSDQAVGRAKKIKVKKGKSMLSNPIKRVIVKRKKGKLAAVSQR